MSPIPPAMRFALVLAIACIVVGVLVWLLPQAVSSTDFGMRPYDKDRIDAFVKILGVGAVFVAATGAWSAARTRRQDLRRQLVRDGHEAIVEIHKDPHASAAVQMMDCFIATRPYRRPDSDPNAADISEEDAWAALRVKGRGPGESAFVYDSFDWFLYYVDRVARLASKGMVDPSDVGAPLRPYAVLICPKREPFDQLALDHGYDEVMRFLERLANPVPVAVTPRR